jgi:hypothetical protein
MDDPISVQAGPVRIQRPTHTIRLPIPTILLRPRLFRPLPIRRTPTIALTATTGLITHPTEARPFPGFLLRKGRVRRVDGAVA